MWFFKRRKQVKDLVETSGELNSEQKHAVTYNGKHLLVIAGAGTGKTKTIIERAKYLVQSGIAPNRIVILSFTRKSAREIVERIKAQVDIAAVKDIQGQTFHSWCMSILKNNPHIFKQSTYTVMDEDDRESCIKIAWGKTIKMNTGRPIRPEAFLKVYSYAMNAKCSLSEAIAKVLLDNVSLDSDNVKEFINSNKPIFVDIIRSYIKYKETRKYLDYDDILNIVAKAMKENAEIRERICSLYDHILIDEMQDTNPLQYELLSSFYEKCHLFCVGDDAQSIYGFRGADFNSIHHFKEVVPESDVCKLTINYRSTQEILDISNWLLNQSPLNYNKELQAARGRGEYPVIINYRDDLEEANDIAHKTLNSVLIDHLEYGDNLVLSRTIRGLRKVELAFIEKKIPYQVFGGTQIMQSAHIRDFVAPLRIVANYLDEIAWMRYLQQWRGIGEVTATKIIEGVILEGDFNKCINRLSNMVQSEISQILIDIYENQHALSKCLEITYRSMKDYLRERYIDSWDWRKEDFPPLIEIADNFGSVSEFITEFVLEPTLQTTLKVPGKERDVVKLSTIHSAKGLEAKNCYILNVSPLLYPTQRAMLNGEDVIEEERRCLYVALTRAQNHLYIYRNVYSRAVDAVTTNGVDINKSYFFNTLPSLLYKNDFCYSVQSSRIPDTFNAQPVLVENDFDFN